jgi:predicted NBD/HSP70 family sugar kinase
MTGDNHRREESTSLRGHVLSLLRDEGPMPRISLARIAGLSPTTITRLISQLLDEGLVSEGGTVSPAGLGRPATDVTLKLDSSYVVGVQVGIGFVSLGVFDVSGTPRASDSFAYPAESAVEEVLATTADRIRRLVSSMGPLGDGLILGIGVAAPGPVDQLGRRVVLPVNLSWRDAPMADILEQATGLPVLVEHNVRSMALAEARFGGGRGHDSVAFVYLRTGLGAGLVVEGEPFAGGVHGAIEIGHLRTSARNQLCVCGARGCLETVVSDAALRRLCEDLGLQITDEGPLARLWAASDDPQVAAAMDEIIEQLAIGLSSLGTLLNPEVIFVGGTLAEMPDEFVDRLVTETRRSLFPVLRDSVQIRRSSLGLNAGVAGAATAALDKFFYA